MPSYPISMKHFFLFLICLAFVFSCKPKRADTLFQLRSAEETGIHFENTIVESDTFNILTTEYIYNGGGVGVADFNNDGLQDVFFVEIWCPINCI